MTDRIIRDFGSWKLFEAEEATASQPDPAALYKAGDRKGLMAIATANDSAAVKAKPGYEAVIKWWTDGHGDLSFWKSMVKSGKSAEVDEKRSLNAAYYWAGSSSTEKEITRLNDFIKAIDATIANKAKVDAWIKGKGKSAPNLSTAWIDGLSQVKEQILAKKKAGLIIKTTPMNMLFPPSYRDNLIDDKPYDVALNSGTTPDFVLGNLARYKPTGKIEQIVANTQNFTASIVLSEADKLAILDNFAKQAQAWANRRNKTKGNSETLESGIAKATNLYIMPANVKVTMTAGTEAGAPVTTTATFSYPDNPKGDSNSEAFKKGLQMFPDDGITIGAQALTELKAAVNDAVAKVKAAGGTITGVTTFAYSSTSQVPTRYGSADATWKAENNVKLANDRLAAINTALSQAITEAGVTVKPTVDAAKNFARPNAGPAWGDAQRKDPKYGKPGARTEAYEQEYGRWRFASAFFTLTYTVTSTETTATEPTMAPSGIWKSYISWSDESISIEIPSISFGGSYPDQRGPKFDPKHMRDCPSF